MIPAIILTAALLVTAVAYIWLCELDRADKFIQEDGG
jgi:hypothetical protein